MLMFVQALNGASGVVYAVFLRNIVDSATEGEKKEFWLYVGMLIALVCLQIVLRAVIRWLTELSKATFENTFKARLMDNILKKDFAPGNRHKRGEEYYGEGTDNGGIDSFP